jgi:ribonuclease BN (tRNA processing enzyme)
VELARGADVLVHESSDDRHKHSRPLDAARAALEADAGQLVLVHLPPGFGPDLEGVRDARAVFPDLQVGEDGAVLEF